MSASSYKFHFCKKADLKYLLKAEFEKDLPRGWLLRCKYTHPSLRSSLVSTSRAPFFSIGGSHSLLANVWAGRAEGAATGSRQLAALLAGWEVMQKHLQKNTDIFSGIINSCTTVCPYSTGVGVGWRWRLGREKGVSVVSDSSWKWPG